MNIADNATVCYVLSNLLTFLVLGFLLGYVAGIATLIWLPRRNKSALTSCPHGYIDPDQCPNCNGTR